MLSNCELPGHLAVLHITRKEEEPGQPTPVQRLTKSNVPPPQELEHSPCCLQSLQAVNQS